MLKPLFIKRKQLNFQKHIDRAKTNPARQSPRAGPFARRSAPGMLPRHDEIPDTLTTHRAGGYEKAAEHKENIDGDAPDELVADKLQEKIARPTPGHRRSMPIDDRQRSEQPHNVHAVVASIEDRAQCVIDHYFSAKKSEYKGKPQQA